MGVCMCVLAHEICLRVFKKWTAGGKAERCMRPSAMTHTNASGRSLQFSHLLVFNDI